MTYPVTITVTGPGSCINVEVELIARALIHEGFNVTVVNEFPNTLTEVQELIDRRRASVIISKEKTNGPHIRIVADHQPWGG